MGELEAAMTTERYPYCPADGRPETSCSDCHRWSPWFAEWVEQSRIAQGLPAKVTDPAVLSQVATLLRSTQP